MFLISIAASLLCLSLSGGLAMSADQSHWAGGIGSTRGEGRQWRAATIELDVDQGRIAGHLKTDNNRIYPLEGVITGGKVSIQLTRRDREIEFSGEIDDDVLSASSDDSELNKLVLRRVAKVPGEQLGTLAGLYQIEPGHKIAFRRLASGQLAMTDYHLGKLRNLYPTSATRFVAGTAIAVAEKIEFVVEFQPGQSTSDFEVRLNGGDYEQAVGVRKNVNVEEFEYVSFDGTVIRGSLTLPATSGPHPAIVWVHGSGPVTRESAGSWPLYYADLGFAVLAVDKRGVGNSEGDYRLPNGGRDNFPHMRRRAQDVAAAVAALRKRPDILPDDIGLTGGSQAGWVIPMASRHADIAFGIIVSGGATPLTVEGRFSRMASEDASGSSSSSVEELIEQLRSYQPADTGIDAELAQMDFPCLWLYGLKDRSNPSQLCVELIERIANEQNRDFTVATFADGNHGLLVCQFGGSAETRMLDRLVPGLHETIRQWLANKALMPQRN